MATGAVLLGWPGEALRLQGMLYGHKPYRHPNKPGSEQEQLRGPSMPGSSGQGCLGSMAGRLSRWPLCSLAGPTNVVASPATGWQEGPAQLQDVKRFLSAQLPSVSH